MSFPLREAWSSHPSFPERIKHLLLTADTDKTLLYTYAAIMGTVITLLLTVTIVPLQQVASQYTPALLRYFRDDDELQAYRYYLVGTLFIVLLCCLFPAYKWTQWLTTVLVAASFIVLVLAVRRITTMLNPVEFLLPKAKEEAKVALEGAFRLSHEDEESDWAEAFALGMEVGDYPQYGEKRIRVPAQKLEVVRLQILPLKTLAERLVGASDFQAFQQLITDLGEISKTYLTKREDYRSYDDSFIWFLRETFEHLIKTSESHPNAKFCEVLYSTVGECGIAVAEKGGKLLGAPKGLNLLQTPFSTLLIQGARRNLERKESGRAFDAFMWFAKIGYELAYRGFPASAEKIATSMYSFGMDSWRKEDTYACAPFFIMFPRIFLQMAWRSKVYPDYQNPYDSMTIMVSLMLEESIKRKLEQRQTNHLVGYSADPSKVANLSWICYAALFSTENDQAVAAHNVRIVRGIWTAIEENLIASGRLALELTTHAYQIGLWLLAAINEKVHAATNTDPSKIILSVPHEPAQKILVSMLTFLMQSYGKTYQLTLEEELTGPERALPYPGPSLKATLSLLYLCLYFEAANVAFVQELKQQVSTMAKLLSSAKREISGDEFESLLLFAAYLEASGKAALAAELRQAILGKKSPSAYRQESVLTALEKPLIGFDDSAFNQWSATIFGFAAKTTTI